MSEPAKLRIAFVHPDLGIGVFKHPEPAAGPDNIAAGGAERLVVDAALGLQKLGHEVVIYTSHHDPNHCFDETRDGTPAELAASHVALTLRRDTQGALYRPSVPPRLPWQITHTLLACTPDPPDRPPAPPSIRQVRRLLRRPTINMCAPPARVRPHPRRLLLPFP